MRPPLLALLLLLPLLSCAASRSGSPAKAVEAQAERAYVLAFLCAGEAAASKSAEERREIQAGHMANIERLARERRLLVAGPFGRSNPIPQWRGIFIFDVRSEAEAAELTATDPAVQAGVLRFETYPLRTQADLGRALERHLAEEEARAARGSSDPGAGMRAYAMLLAHEGERALSLLEGRPEVCVQARLGGDWEGRAWFLLDAEDLAAAEALLAPLQAQLGTCELLPWYGSDALSRLDEAPGS